MKKIITAIMFTSILCCQTTANAIPNPFAKENSCASAQIADKNSYNGWKYEQGCHVKWEDRDKWATKKIDAGWGISRCDKSVYSKTNNSCGSNNEYSCGTWCRR